MAIEELIVGNWERNQTIDRDRYSIQIVVASLGSGAWWTDAHTHPHTIVGGWSTLLDVGIENNVLYSVLYYIK